MMDAPENVPKHGNELSCTGSNNEPRMIASSGLFQGEREIWIAHGKEMYRLRITTSGKLYLTK
jgi:hemin uptake protein HemP